MSVLFGVSPLLTALLSRVLLGEDSLTPRKLLAQGCCIGGLTVIYASASSVGATASLGIAAGLLLHEVAPPSFARRQLLDDAP